jgi:hypothetical protein
MCAAIFLVPPTWDLRDYTQDFGKWLNARSPPPPPPACPLARASRNIKAPGHEAGV